MKSYYIDKKKLICPITKSKKFEKIFSIKKFPIYMGTIDKKQKYLFKSLNFLINKESGSVQIFPRVDLKKLYFKSHGSGKIGNVWQNHHKKFYSFLGIKNKNNIIEIGGGHNPISAKLLIKKKKASLTSFDPNGKPSNVPGHTTVKDFFHDNLIKKYNLKNKFDLAIHSHLFEHIYEAENFLKAIYLSLKPNGMHIFAVPNMKPMIKKGIASAMNFEHPFYLDENTIQFLLNKNGFKILKKKYFGKNHSIFYKTKKILPSKNLVAKNYYNLNFKIFKRLNLNWKKDIKLINKKIKNKKHIYLFGAHIFSQMLLFNGLNKNKILNILDNDPDKQGGYLYGTDIQVLSPKILKKSCQPIVILRAGEYNFEIKKDIIQNINKHTKFI